MADRSDKPGLAARAKASPHHAPCTQVDKAARQARLAAEMRSNLLKRKRQRRARDGDPPKD